MIYNGDEYHAAICAYVLPLGVDWTYGLSLLFILFFIYRATNTWVGSGIIGLLFTALFYLYLPQPAITMLGIGIGLGIGFLLYGLWQENKPNISKEQATNFYNRYK